MHRVFCIAALILSWPLMAIAEFSAPLVDLRVAAEALRLSTWAHAGGKAAIRIESPESLTLTCDIYQVDGKTVISLARGVVLDSLTPGANLLEIPLPEKSQRGKLLLKIASTPAGKLIANLFVDILPKDAWDSLSKHAENGKVFIDPSLKNLASWAQSHAIPSTPVTSETPAEYYFGKPTGNPNAPPPGRFIIFERETPDAFPVIEVITAPEVTKILLPPGFLENFPTSATAQALLLKHLKLLPVSP